MSKRRISNPLALAVLAFLAERPMHPYEMASTMRERHKDDAIKLNYGSLYSVMESLCRNQLIVAKETVKDGKRPERTIYELTESGQYELYDWLGELLAHPVKEFTQFEAGLSLMPVLPPEKATELLQHRIDMLEINIAKAKSILTYTQGKKLPRLYVIDREYHTMVLEAELIWLRELVAEIASNKLEGMEEWHGWHPESAESSKRP